MGYQVGLRGATRPSQILGIVLEDALCELLMMHPPEVSSFEELRDWAFTRLDDVSISAMETGTKAWDEVLWKSADDAWEAVSVSSLKERLAGGLEIFFEEVKACYDVGGGPFLEVRRTNNQPFSVPEPSLGSPPSFPLPEKVRDVELRSWVASSSPVWSQKGSDITWHEAWECARPWFKDPRVHQPQRLYHPDGWASGELDLVLRWDGRIRIVDIKSGNPGSMFSSSLEHQLRFYAWLWHATHEGEVVAEMEGWYLEASARVPYEVPTAEEMDELTETYALHHRSMQDHASGVMPFPAPPESACDGTAAGCVWCGVSRSNDEDWEVPEHLDWIRHLPDVKITAPYAPLGQVQGRVAVTGRLTGAWGPMPNHFSEHVLGAVLVVGNQHITLEESEPGAFPDLHEHLEQEVLVIDALPGVWRDQARLYVDRSTKLLKPEGMEGSEIPELTRLGLLRTRANVKGHVLSIRRRSGTRIDGKPWTMLSIMLWDGHHLAEVVAFGASINQRLLSLRPGDGLAMTGAELGWRSGILQLRIDNRKTRMETFSVR